MPKKKSHTEVQPRPQGFSLKWVGKSPGDEVARGCPLFLKMLFQSLHEIVENSDLKFWSNGKRPLSFFTL